VLVHAFPVTALRAVRPRRVAKAECLSHAYGRAVSAPAWSQSLGPRGFAG
jgi:hypothetical protein